MTTADTTTTALWRDPTRPAAERARDLLQQMTTPEKLAQLGSSWPGADDAGGEVAPMQETVLRARPFDQEIEDGLGHLTRAFGTAPVTPAEGARRLAGLQRQIQGANRFGLPAIAHEECLTGFTTWQATVYPTALAWGATFNPELVQAMAAAIGNDLASVGVHQGLSPVLDVVRDYRWGRVEETMGEDPYLVSRLGVAYIQGLQSAGIVATLKHFAGYSASRGARNHAPVSLGQRELHDVVLPPFEAAVRSGARSVMNSYTETDGVPAASDEYLLTTVLRTQWGFTGTVVSDYWAIPFLETMHRTAATTAEAGLQALAAGMDVELPHTLAFSPDLLANGPDMDLLDLLDRAALRVLTQKAELGLLNQDWDPDAALGGPIDLDPPANRALARELAKQSVVLLHNRQQLLPLNQDVATIAIIGPGIEDPGCFFGCYSFPNHVVPNHPGTNIGIEAANLVQAIRQEFPSAAIRTAKGTDINSTDRSGIAAAAALAADSDVTIVMVGDRSGMFGHGTSGEGCDAVDLRLPGSQDALVDAVLNAGKNVVLLTVSGRPYAIGGFADRAGAALQVFFPGEEGGAAIASVLSGATNPSGRLPVQIPGNASTQPGTYLAPPLALKSDGVSNLDPTPAFPFGHGQSYTDFTITNVTGDHDRLDLDGTVRITATVTNTGQREGWEIPQLYLTHKSGSVTRPVRRLVGFHRVHLTPGETAEVTFQVHADITGFTGRDLRRRVEPGTVIFTVAANAGDPGATVTVTLEGPAPRYLDKDSVLSVPTSSSETHPHGLNVPEGLAVSRAGTQLAH